MTDDPQAIARGLVHLLPERTKAVIRASSADFSTSGQIADAAGLASGASIVKALLSGFHERKWAGNQHVWRLNDLGHGVQSILKEQADG